MGVPLGYARSYAAQQSFANFSTVAVNRSNISTIVVCSLSE